jgi:hypothetical protein
MSGGGSPAIGPDWQLDLAAQLGSSTWQLSLAAPFGIGSGWQSFHADLEGGTGLRGPVALGGNGRAPISWRRAFAQVYRTEEGWFEPRMGRARRLRITRRQAPLC